MITENVSTLKINTMSQEKYDREYSKGNISSTEIYLTPDDVIDQTYNPESENAQSGTAVAEAVADKPTLHTGNEFEIVDGLATTTKVQMGNLPYKIGDFYFNTDTLQLFIFTSVTKTGNITTAKVELISNDTVIKALQNKQDKFGNVDNSDRDISVATEKNLNLLSDGDLLFSCAGALNLIPNNPRGVELGYVNLGIPTPLLGVKTPSKTSGAYLTDEDLPYQAVNKQYVDEQIGDISTALDELHSYAQAIINGGVTE